MLSLFSSNGLPSLLCIQNTEVAYPSDVVYVRASITFAPDKAIAPASLEKIPGWSSIKKQTLVASLLVSVWTLVGML